MHPRLVPVPASTITHATRALEAMWGPCRGYRVVSGGHTLGRDWKAGELVICGGLGALDATTVLCPVGFGRPRLGSLTEKGLIGAAGEPCDPRRWVVLGRVLDVLPRSRQRAALATPRAGQLALFEAAHAA